MQAVWILTLLHAWWFRILWPNRKGHVNTLYLTCGHTAIGLVMKNSTACRLVNPWYTTNGRRITARWTVSWVSTMTCCLFFFIYAKYISIYSSYPLCPFAYNLLAYTFSRHHTDTRLIIHSPLTYYFNLHTSLVSYTIPSQHKYSTFFMIYTRSSIQN